MADADKKISIELSAKGGAGSAAEVKKLESAVELTKDEVAMLRRALDQVEGEGPEFDAAMEKMEAALREVDMSADRAAASVAAVGKAGPKTTKSTRNMGLATLEAARAFEDLQYGVRGVLNNIPGLITMLGGSAGLAGVISFAAVAASQLIPKLLDTGDTAKEAAEKMATAQEAAADAAEESADRIAEAELEKVRAQSGDVIRGAREQVEAYEEQIDAVDRLGRKLRELRALRLAETDASAAEQLSQVNLDEELGRISAIEATRQRAGIESRAAQERVQAEIDTLTADLDEMRRRLAIQENLEAAKRAGAGQAEAAQSGATSALEDALATRQRARDLDVEVEEIKASIDLLESEVNELNFISESSGVLTNQEAARLSKASSALRAARTRLTETEAEAEATDAAVLSPRDLEKLREAEKAAIATAKAAREELEAQVETNRELTKELETRREISKIRTERLQRDLQSGERVRANDLAADETREVRREQERANREEERGINAGAKGVAGELSRLADEAEERSIAPDVAEGIDRLAKALNDGTNAEELATANDRLISLAEGTQETSQILSGKLSDQAAKIGALEARMQALQRQIANSRGR